MMNLLFEFINISRVVKNRRSRHETSRSYETERDATVRLCLRHSQHVTRVQNANPLAFHFDFLRFYFFERFLLWFRYVSVETCLYDRSLDHGGRSFLTCSFLIHQIKYQWIRPALWRVVKEVVYNSGGRIICIEQLKLHTKYGFHHLKEIRNFWEQLDRNEGGLICSCFKNEKERKKERKIWNIL